MADPGRLDELKRRFDENPKRYFAPLANEYRKAGEAELAIELCRTYLPQQPSHMSGYIVYGQGLYDAGRPDESAAVFKQALTLDPENLIALRHLGDIARDSGAGDEAITWYNKVLELDPRNEEVASLVGLGASAAASPATGGPERPIPPTIRPEPEPDESAVRLEDIVSEPDFAQPGAGRRDVRHQELAAEAEPAWEEEFHETAGDSFGFGLGQPMEPTQSPLEGLSGGISEIEQENTSSFVEGPWHSDTQQPEHVEHEEHVIIDQPALSMSSSPFVTETMAELYMQQGLRGEALGIYRQLALKRDDPALRDRIAELEKDDASSARRETVRDFFARIGSVRTHEKVQLAGDPSSPLASLFGGTSADASDLDAAQRLAAAFGSRPTGGSHS